MIINYGFSLVGKSHVTRNVCCQDSHKIKKMENGWYIAAIADGVGSAKNSHIGSKIAVDTVVSFCNEFMPWDYSVIGIKSMLRTAYNYAFKQILRESKKSGEPIESYDTTLTVAIYDGHRIIYGHSGDGAIIGLTIYGNYVQITKPQKGADLVSVLPLRSGYTEWSIDTYDEDLAAVMLMTDGMLETLCPYLLKNNTLSDVYVPLASFFSDPQGFSNNSKTNKKSKSLIEEFLIANDDYNSEHFYNRLLKIYKKHIPEKAEEIISDIEETNYPIAFMKNEQDDKTMVVLLNTDIDVENKIVDFYSEPNWTMLQEEWNKKAYPHLYKKSKTDKNLSSDETSMNSSLDNNKGKDKTELSREQENEKLNDRTEHVEYKSDDVRDNSSVPQNFQQQIPIAPKHSKPKKQGLLDKILDIFEQ
jgi:hypothetical protein